MSRTLERDFVGTACLFRLTTFDYLTKHTALILKILRMNGRVSRLNKLRLYFKGA